MGSNCASMWLTEKIFSKTRAKLRKYSIMSLISRADRKSQVRKCLGFCTSKFLSSLAYESAKQKQKHYLTWDSHQLCRPSLGGVHDDDDDDDDDDDEVCRIGDEVGNWDTCSNCRADRKSQVWWFWRCCTAIIRKFKFSRWDLYPPDLISISSFSISTLY